MAACPFPRCLPWWDLMTLFISAGRLKTVSACPRLHFGRNTVRNKKKPEQISSGRGRGYLKIVCVLLPGAFNDGLMVWPL